MTRMRHHPPPSPIEPRVELRAQYQRELDALEGQLRTMEAEARHLLALALRALATNDAASCEAVVRGDDDIDRRYVEIEHGVVSVMARQQPVASDLRVLLAIDHAALHLERIGDEAVNIARAVRLAGSLVPSEELLDALQKMGEAVASMSELAVEAFTRRDGALCERVARLDGEVDELDRDILGEILTYARNDGPREWAARMNRVSRHLERAADHAVDIAEQAWFVITGELRELD